MTKQLIKAELHCHLEGTISPQHVLELAEKYSVDTKGVIENDRYIFDDFSGFIKTYAFGSDLLRSEEDFSDLTYRYLIDISKQGAIYCEFTVSPFQGVDFKISPAAYINAIAEGIERAKTKTGIEARMIMTGVRHLGAQEVEKAAALCLKDRHPLITGFGLAGDERQFENSDFIYAFDMARDAGLGITAHAGELLGPECVSSALECFKPSRIGHGVRSIENLDVVKRLVDENIVLEVCVGSNIALEIYPSYDKHPIRELYKHGVVITLSSDDPPFFKTNLQNEYDLAEKTYGFDESVLRSFTRNSIMAAFVDEPTRAQLLAKL